MLRNKTINRTITVLLMAFTIVMAGTLNVARASVPVKYVPICIDDLCVTVPVTGDYYVKVADFNSDGKPDLYVTGHPTRRYVSDFLLYQNTPTSYTIAPTPTPTQVALAKAAPISSITVSRMELNADRYYDFYLRNVEEAIPNAVDIIVTLARGTGGTPQDVVPVTPQFEKLLSVYTTIISAADSYVHASQQTICGPGSSSTVAVSLPSSSWGDIIFPDRHYDYDPPWMPYFPDFGWGGSTFSSGAGNISVLFGTPPPPVCMPAYNILSSEYKDLILNTLTPSTSPQDTIWSAQWCARVWGQYGKTCPNRYLLDNAMVGGLVVGTVIIIAVLYYTNKWSNDRVRDLTDATDSAANEGYVGSVPIPPNATVANQADVGPGTSAIPLTGVDKYAFQSNCNDMGPTNVPQNRGAEEPGDSGALGEHMRGRGCGCPDGSDAHHILPKADGEKFPVDLKNRIRGCLNNAGIDVDHPENGVCLPQKKDPNSNAIVHGSANKETYWRSIAQLCEDAYGENGTQGVRDMLQQARKNLINGNAWWKPWGGPFWP